MGVEGPVLHAGIQHADPAAAGCGGVPAVKAIARPGGGRQDGGGQVRVVALNSGAAGAAVAVVEHIAVVGGRCRGIESVQVQVGFAETATDQTGENGAAGVAPEGQRMDEAVARGAVQHGGAKLPLLVEPAGAAVEGEHGQSVKLILGQGDAVGGGEVVQSPADGVGVCTQQGFGLRLGDAVAQVAVQVLIGAAGAVAHGVLGVVPIGHPGEALEFFQQVDALLAHAHAFRSIGPEAQRKQAHHQKQR